MNQLVFKRDNQNQLTIPSSLRIVWILSLLALMITIPNDLEAQAIWKALDASELKKASQADQRKPIFRH